jgi:hypothetical protein
VNPYFIIALPRSRTAWLSAFLTTEDSDCLHDPLGQCESLDDLERLFVESGAPIIGCADTSSPIFFNAINERWPDSKYLFVFREPKDIAASLDRLEMPSAEVPMMQVRMNSAYLSVRSRDNVRALPFEHLSQPAALEALWEFLIGTPFDLARAERFNAMNIQIDPREAMANADEDRILKLLRSTGVIEA